MPEDNDAAAGHTVVRSASALPSSRRPSATAGPAGSITGEVIRSSKVTAVLYQRDRPGELVHMDVKKIGRVPDGGGWRVHGRGAGDNRDRKHGLGYDYVHSLVDDHSRLAYSEVLPDEKGTTCAAFLTRAIDYFTGHGITRIERLTAATNLMARYS